jgi:hypothetical protein
LSGRTVHAVDTGCKRFRGGGSQARRDSEALEEEVGRVARNRELEDWTSIDEEPARRKLPWLKRGDTKLRAPDAFDRDVRPPGQQVAIIGARAAIDGGEFATEIPSASPEGVRETS